MSEFDPNNPMQDYLALMHLYRMRYLLRERTATLSTHLTAGKTILVVKVQKRLWRPASELTEWLSELAGVKCQYYIEEDRSSRWFELPVRDMCTDRFEADLPNAVLQLHRTFLLASEIDMVIDYQLEAGVGPHFLLSNVKEKDIRTCLDILCLPSSRVRYIPSGGLGDDRFMLSVRVTDILAVENTIGWKKGQPYRTALKRQLDAIQSLALKRKTAWGD